jgi:hypothetical protein
MVQDVSFLPSHELHVEAKCFFLDWERIHWTVVTVKEKSRLIATKE